VTVVDSVGGGAAAGDVEACLMAAMEEIATGVDQDRDDCALDVSGDRICGRTVDESWKEVASALAAAEFYLACYMLCGWKRVPYMSTLGQDSPRKTSRGEAQTPAGHHGCQREMRRIPMLVFNGNGSRQTFGLHSSTPS
jgi:hypothetical protein